MDQIWQDLRNKMNDVKQELPEGTIGPFVDDEFGDVSVVLVALTAKGFSMAEMRDVARDMQDDFYTIPGIRKVDLHGVQSERVFLEISNARLAQYGLSPTELSQTLMKQNIILPGGSVDTGAVELVVEPSGNFESVEDIENVVIRLPSSNQVAYLKDIATVKRAYIDPPVQKVYYDGEPAIILAVEQMETGVNVLDFTPRVQKRVEEWQDRLPIGYQVDVAFYQAQYVAESVNGVAMNLVQTLVTVLAVVMLFLGLRTGLIVGTIVPLTMIVTLVWMWVLGIELHRITLATHDHIPRSFGGQRYRNGRGNRAADAGRGGTERRCHQCRQNPGHAAAYLVADHDPGICAPGPGAQRNRRVPELYGYGSRHYPSNLVGACHYGDPA